MEAIGIVYLHDYYKTPNPCFRGLDFVTNEICVNFLNFETHYTDSLSCNPPSPVFLVPELQTCATRLNFEKKKSCGIFVVVVCFLSCLVCFVFMIRTSPRMV